jgi:hypothetical protein
VGVWPASGARSNRNTRLVPIPIPQQRFLIYMLILWAHCSTVIVLIISLSLLITRLSGWKPSPFQKRPQRYAQKLYLLLGFLALECPKRSLLIVSRNLLPIIDFIFAKFLICISHKHTTAFQPELNGTVERLHRRLKDALRARAAAATWSEELPFVLLRLRAEPREDTGLSLAEAVFGAQIVLPNKFLQNDELSVDTIVKNFSKT